MNYFLAFTIAAMCSIHLGSCQNKKAPDCVLRAWIIKDQSTGTIVATNVSPFTFDTTTIVIFPLPKCGDCPFVDEYKVAPTETVLNQREINDVDSLYKKAIVQHNAALPENQKQYRGIDMAKPYKRQYIAATNVKGEKEVWVNAFCSNSPDWKKRLIQVEDGGSCYFNVLINLTTESAGKLRVNGEG